MKPAKTINTLFAPGDRVTMRSEFTSTVGAEPPILQGTVETWPSGLVVVWDSWPCVTALPNPNVSRLKEASRKRKEASRKARREATLEEYQAVAANILVGIADGTPVDQRADNVANTIEDAHAIFHEARLVAMVHYLALRFDVRVGRWGEIGGASARTVYTRRVLLWAATRRRRLAAQIVCAARRRA